MPHREWKVRYLRLVRKVHRFVGHRHLRHRSWWKPVRAAVLDRRLWQPCRDTVAGGVSIGCFFAMMPLPGQTIAASLLAARARVNIPFAFIACFITNPITTPIIRPAQLAFGNWLHERVGIPVPDLGEVDLHFGDVLVELNVSNFILGFLVSGVLTALAAYPLVRLFSYLLPQVLPSKSPVIHAKRRQTPVP